MIGFSASTMNLFDTAAFPAIKNSCFDYFAWEDPLRPRLPFINRPVTPEFAGNRRLIYQAPASQAALGRAGSAPFTDGTTGSRLVAPLDPAAGSTPAETVRAEKI